MFLKLAKFEFNYFRRQPSFYVISLIFFLLTFFAMISDNVRIGSGGNVNFNSPHAITQTLAIMSLIGMFLVANFIGGTATRDRSFKMDGFMLATPVNDFSYLWGRWLGALGFCLLVFAAVPLGLLIGSFWPTVDAERLGATTLGPYFWAYLVFVIPNFVFCSALFYSFAMLTRSMMGMYLSVIGFFILFSIAGTLLDTPALAELATLLDPFGLSAFAEATRYWTPAERNSQLVSLSGPLLTNRLLWLGIAVAIMVATHWYIDLRKPLTQKSSKKKGQAETPPPTGYKAVAGASGRTVDWQRFLVRTGFEVRQIIKSAPFIILCLFSLFSMGSVFFEPGGYFGTANWPLTRNMTDVILGSFGLLMLVVMTYYSAETVWREREIGVGDIVESTPIANWTIYFPKVIALSTVILVLMIVGIAFSVAYQVINAYTNFEWGVYAAIMFVQFLIPMLMSVVLAVFIQVLSPNKFIGMLIFVVYMISTIVLSQLGLEHNLWHFAEGPDATYSDLNGFGHFMAPIVWYNIYWAGLTLLLVVLGFGLWRRGAEYGLRHRFSQLRGNIRSTGLAATALGLATFIGAGSYIFYNTAVVNDFTSSKQLLDLRADFEKQYKQYESLVPPTITDVNVNVDIYPSERRIEANGYYLIENRTDQPLTRTLISWARQNLMEFDVEGAAETERDDRFSLAWLEFTEPLQPGEQRQFNYRVERKSRGFTDGASDTNVVENGTFINNAELLPHFGYRSDYELADRHERRKRDLPPPQRLPKLEDESHYGTNFVGQEADFINFETIVSTSEDQIAMSPGYLQREWAEDGRRYFHYKMDAPIFNFFAFQSGRYAIERDEHDGINIEVYHHPDHNMNVERMIESVKDSLDYFGREFSPYQHRQVRIIEFPRYASFAQSFSNTVPYSEDIGFIADLRDPDDIDYVYFVTAHEMAHQWWGHQITPANVQGAAVLSESLSEYSAYMVLEKKYGKDHLRKFLKWEMDRYLRGRGNEIVEEMPLMRAENQQYIHYQKGGVVMYAMRDRLGEGVFNTALRKFLERFQYAYDPYPTTLDLLEYLKAEAPAADHAFIDDLFAKITLFDLKVKSAEATELADGRYRLDLIVDANKYYADGDGAETETELSEPFDIGVFTEDPDDPDAKEHVLYFDKHTIANGENTISLELDKLPKFAGIDPYVKMIDRNSNDNLIGVKLVAAD